MNRRVRHLAFVILVAACAPTDTAPLPADTVATAPTEIPDPWRPYWEGADGTVSAVDTTRIGHLADGGVLAWVRLSYPDSIGAGDAFPLETRAVETQHHIDCARGESAVGQVVARDARDRALVELPTGDELRYVRVQPETAGSALVALVCFTTGTPAPAPPGARVPR